MSQIWERRIGVWDELTAAAEGSDWVPEPALDSELALRVARLCRLASRRFGGDPFRLGMRKCSALLGVDPDDARDAMRKLEKRGWLVSELRGDPSLRIESSWTWQGP
jgi:hypothetical protein